MQGLKQTFAYSWLHPRFLALRYIRAFVAEHGSELTGRLLDVGCGKRPYAALFAKLEAYVGMDVPGSMHGLTFVDVVATASAIPFRDAAFDSLLCTEVLEHTPEPLIVLQELARVAKSQAILLLTVPLSEQLHEEPYDFFRFTKYSLQHMLPLCGWQIKTLVPRGGGWAEMGYRLSSFAYTQHGSRRGVDGNLHPRWIMGPLVIVFCTLVQLIGAALDRLFPSQLSTIGWGVIAVRDTAK